VEEILGGKPLTPTLYQESKHGCSLLWHPNAKESSHFPLNNIISKKEIKHCLKKIDYQLAFNDEFKLPILDTTKWSHRYWNGYHIPNKRITPYPKTQI